MYRSLLLFLLPVILPFSAWAQFNYIVAASIDTYVPLAAGVPVNDTIIWDDMNFRMPVGFNFEMDGQVNDTVYISRDNLLAIDSATAVNLFVMTEMELTDRGNFKDTETRSPMRYQLTGTAPNRIFKFELANAGITLEHNMYGTNKDSVNIQVWLYETSNVVELRYGPSQVSHPSDYHYLSGKSLNGYIKKFNLSQLAIQMGYFLTGKPASPTIDSASDLFSINGGLDTYPPNGSVYRFTPKPLSINSQMGRLDKLELLSNTGASQVVLNNQYADVLNYKILSLNGAAMYHSGSLKKGVNSVDISYLPHGMYLLYVAGNEGLASFRINKL